MAKIYEDNSFAIGNTPLVKLKSVTKNAKATVLAKIEGRNPAYSVKCRIGANMIWDAEKSGKLTKDKTIVEPTSGNTGIALAFTASARGYKLILTMPESMSIERRRVMAVLGAEIVLTEASKGMPGAIAKAKKLQKVILLNISCQVNLIIQQTLKFISKLLDQKSGMIAMVKLMS